MSRLAFSEAELLAADVAALTDEQVRQCWHAYASYISYLNADDYGGDWKLVPRHRPKLEELRAENDRRGLPTLKGEYLL